jgi:hypothetical protein
LKGWLELQVQYFDAVAKAEAVAQAAAAAAAAAKHSKTVVGDANHLLKDNDFADIDELEDEIQAAKSTLSTLEGDGRGETARATKLRASLKGWLELQVQYFEAVARATAAEEGSKIAVSTDTSSTCECCSLLLDPADLVLTSFLISLCYRV